MSHRQSHSKFDFSFKILFLGGVGVGKTSIIFRYVDNILKNEQKSTIGIDYKTKIVEYKSKKIKLKIFDTSGQERFRTLTKNYYHGSDGIIMVFDIKKRETLEDISYWMGELNKNIDSKKIGLLLVGNKNDGNLEERKINKEEGVNISNLYNFKYIETSALKNDNIKECFDLIIYSILEKKNIKIDDSISKNKKQFISNVNKGIILDKLYNNNNNVNTNQNNENYLRCCNG